MRCFVGGGWVVVVDVCGVGLGDGQDIWLSVKARVLNV